MSDELWRRSAGELAAMIRDQTVSSREVVEAHLERIDAVNKTVNAVTVVLADTALAAADAADASKPVGALHGVPFSIKENIDCVGSATTHGVPAMAEAMPPVDAPVVARMKAAGGIPLARTNLPEMGLRITTDNPLHGRTLNPWDRERTAGGSSGGEGAATATGMSPLGLGNDIGGSLRNPSYCCGITALKPSAGRIPHAGSIPPLDGGLAGQLMAVEGPMARHVADLEIALGVLAGRDPRDPDSVDAPLAGPTPASKSVALVTEVPLVDLPASTIAAVREAGAALMDAGWHVEEVLPPDLARVTEIWAHVLSNDFAELIPELTPIMSKEAIRLLQGVVERYDPAQMSNMELYKERRRLMREWSNFFGDYPLIVGPTWTDLPFHHDADIDADNGVDVTVDRLRFISPGNVLGLPSVALPTGIADAMPCSVQVYAERWREDLCLAGAAAIEARLGRLCPIDPVF